MKKTKVDSLASGVLYGSGEHTGRLYVQLLLEMIERESDNATSTGRDMKALLPVWEEVSSIITRNFKQAVERRLSELQRSEPTEAKHA
jgi:hypothetical protein